MNYKFIYLTSFFKTLIFFCSISILFLMSHFKAFCNEKEISIFFSNNKIFLEKNNKLVNISSQINIHKKFYSFEVISGPKFCNKIISLSNNYLEIKDPLNNMQTYSECKILLKDKFESNEILLLIKLNRMFTSWCAMNESSNTGVNKTVNAVLKVMQIESCGYAFLDETLSNARMLNLSNQKLYDLSPIASLVNLRALWLDNNEVNDLNPLGSLKNLFVLSLSNNNIYDVNVLKNLKKLQWLFLGSNLIEKVDSLKFLNNIKVLSIKNNNIYNLSPLFQLNENSLIIANGNPAQSEVCKYFENENNGYKKINWLEKLCKNPL